MFQLAGFARRGKTGVSLNLLVAPCLVTWFRSLTACQIATRLPLPGRGVAFLPRWRPPSQGPVFGLLGQQSDDITGMLLALWLDGVVFPSFHHPPNQTRCGAVLSDLSAFFGLQSAQHTALFQKKALDLLSQEVLQCRRAAAQRRIAFFVSCK